MIITISGPIASGKTTAAELVAKKLGLRHISAGSIMRQMASQRGMSLLELSELAERDSSVDKEIDRRQVELASSGSCVVEGRLSAHIIDADLRVLLVAPLEIRARRLAEREKKSLGEAIAEIERRERSERLRYERIYGIDVDDHSVYDLIINTEKLGPEETAELIRVAASLRCGSNRPQRL